MADLYYDNFQQAQPTPVSKDQPTASSKPEEVPAPSAAPTKNLTPHNHPFATYCEHPKNIWFHDKATDEEILLLLRKHFVTNVPWIVFTLVLLIIPPILFALFSSSLGQAGVIPETILPARYIGILTLFYYLVVLGYALVSFITWFYNVSLVTSKRIVDIDFSDVVYHNVAATKLTLVQDVDYTQSGFIRSLFNYGDVFVQTASESPNFDFLAVPLPQQVTNLVESLIGKRPYLP